MHAAYRVLEVRRGQVLAQPLDGVRPERLKLVGASRCVENEVIVVEPHAASSQIGPKWQVRGSRIDPSFIGENPIQLAPIDDMDGYEFTDYVSYEEEEFFHQAVECLESGRYNTAANILRDFIKEFPFHIDSYHHLGIIEMDFGRLDRALKYFETGYRIGLLRLPEDFYGKLPWLCLGNRPFLRAAHGYGLALDQKRRHLEAIDIFERMLAWNPVDNQGIRLLLPSSYLQAKAPQMARLALEHHGTDGMNRYTMCLLEIENGRHREALRWLCRALSYNLHLPALVLTGASDAASDEPRVAVGSRSEAIEYLQDHPGWRRKPARAFLQRVVAVDSFARRLERATKLAAALDAANELPPGELRSDKVAELYDAFDEKHIPRILEECRDVL
jgi:tetratricopeptide (TPR) repeat protein